MSACPFEVGDILEVVAAPSEDPSPPPIGLRGTVRDVTDTRGMQFMGSDWQLGVDWDGPCRLMLVIPPDETAVRKVAP